MRPSSGQKSVFRMDQHPILTALGRRVICFRTAQQGIT